MSGMGPTSPTRCGSRQAPSRAWMLSCARAFRVADCPHRKPWWSEDGWDVVANNEATDEAPGGRGAKCSPDGELLTPTTIDLSKTLLTTDREVIERPEINCSDSHSARSRQLLCGGLRRSQSTSAPEQLTRSGDTAIRQPIGASNGEVSHLLTRSANGPESATLSSCVLVCRADGEVSLLKSGVHL